MTDNLTSEDKNVIASVFRELGKGEAIYLSEGDYERCNEIAEKVENE